MYIVPNSTELVHTLHLALGAFKGRYASLYYPPLDT